MPRLLLFGIGFSGAVLARRCLAQGWSVIGTTRSSAKLAALRAEGLDADVFDGTQPAPRSLFAGVTHILSSVPPDEQGDPVLRQHAGDLGAATWIGYLSTTGVYGDHGGGWVDEETPASPDVPRSIRRLAAERAWQALSPAAHIFRLAGIYGPGRNALEQVRAGTARRVIKPGHVFSRIHVEDIAAVVEASMARPHPGRLYNVCDDEPAAPDAVIAHAATLLGAPLPPALPFEAAQQTLSPMALSFYADNRRVRNQRIKEELGVRLAFPTYREGLAALLSINRLT